MVPNSFSPAGVARALCACAVLAAGSSWAAPRYQIVDLGAAPSPLPSAVAALNRSGIAVGSVLINGALACVTFDHGAIGDLGTMGGSSCVAGGVNDAGTIVGSLALTDGTGNTHAFSYQGGVVSDLGTIPDHPSSAAVGINNKGHVVGNASNPIDNQVVIWRNGKTRIVAAPADGVGVSASAISAHDAVTGTVQMVNDHRHAFVWQNGQSHDLGTLGNQPNGESAGNAINELGQVAGFSSGDGFPCHAALFANGTITDLGTIPANDPFAKSEATDIDNRGWVVGTSDDGSGTTYAILWDGKKLNDLGQLLDPTATVAWQLVSAQAINKLGQITGMAISRTDGSMHVYLAVPIS
jgi:probable HAF family extracellular repeat protein